MGCGKSKHAVETANTLVKSTNSDCTKETSTTKTITEKGDSSLIQKEVETKSVFVQDTKKETLTTKIDPSNATKIDNVLPKSIDNIENVTQVFKVEEKIKDSDQPDVGNPNLDNVSPSPIENIGKVVEVLEEDEKVRDNSPIASSDANTKNVITPTSKGDVSTVESTLADNKIKTGKVSPIEEEENKEPKVTKDTKGKTEFMTPTLSEDVVGPFEVVREDEEVGDSKEENIESEVIDDNLVKTINNSTNTKDSNLKVEEQNVVAPAVESTKRETKTDEDVKVSEVEIANAKTSPMTEHEKVPIVDEVNVSQP